MKLYPFIRTIDVLVRKFIFITEWGVIAEILRFRLIPRLNCLADSLNREKCECKHFYQWTEKNCVNFSIIDLAHYWLPLPTAEMSFVIGPQVVMPGAGPQLIDLHGPPRHHIFGHDNDGHFDRDKVDIRQ